MKAGFVCLFDPVCPVMKSMIYENHTINTYVTEESPLNSDI